MASRLVLLFTKPAVPGRVKTRLIGHLTAEQAAELHQAFLEDLQQRLEGGRFRLKIAWALERGESAPSAADGNDLRQRGAGLGERLFNGLSEAVEEADLVAAIGSDHPELTAEVVDGALDVLERGAADVVLGPARDGGYYLIGLHRQALDPGLFSDIPWSTSTVFAVTMERCRTLGFSVHRLAVASDVDTPDDLERLAPLLERGELESPRTAALLEKWQSLAVEEGR